MMPITKKGYHNLKERIKLVKIEFEKTPSLIAQAREKGDLKENAEYHAARERQGMLNAELGKLNAYLAETEIIDPSTLPADAITFGKIVKLEDLSNETIVEYTLVGPAETDAEKKLISVTSHLAKGLLGKKSGEQVEINVPSGIKKYKVLDITYF